MIGREFDYDVLRRSSRRPATSWSRRSRRASRRACCARSGHVGRYGFTHALVRATLYDSISQLRRARLHGRVGEALVRLRGGDLDPHLAMLAHHFAQAAPVERPDRAIDFALAAARRADRMLAWEEAAQHYRAALRARELSGAVDDHVRAELLLALGASEDRAGLEEEARETFQAAIRTARQLGDAVLLSARRSRRGGAVVGALALRSGARVAARGGAGGPARRGLAAARAAARADVAGALLRGRAGAAAVAVRGGGGDRLADRRSAHAGDVPGRAPLRAVAARERRGAARGRRRAAARGRGDRRPGARAAGRGLDDHRPDGARRHRRRRHPDRRGVEARRGAAPADLAVVDVAVPRRAGAAGGRVRRGRAAHAGDAGDRPARAGRERPALLRAGDVQHPPRAGPPGRGRGRRARLHRALPGDPGVARGAGAAARRAGPPGRGAQRVRAGRRGRLRGLPARRELADLDHADGRGVRRFGRRGARGGALRAARALRGPQRARGPQRDLQRLRVAAAGDPGGRRAASSRWPRATSTRRSGCTWRWARGRGTRGRRWRMRRCCSARRGAGDVERATEMLADAILVADALGMVVLAERARRLVPTPRARRSAGRTALGRAVVSPRVVVSVAGCRRPTRSNPPRSGPWRVCRACRSTNPPRTALAARVVDHLPHLLP